MTAIGVVGAGTMGVGIAYVFAAAGAEVSLVDPDPKARQRSVEQLHHLADEGVRRDRLRVEQAAAIRQTTRLVASVSELPEDLHVVIEAVPERLELKQSVLQSIEVRAPRLVASNTSSISIGSLALCLNAPERLVGMHFFNPVWANDLVELVHGDRTSEESIRLARELVALIGKTSILVKDRPGFASTRLGVLLGLEAIRMVEDGVASADDIDTAMTLGYRHPMGPLRLTDLIGLDVRLDIAENLMQAYGPRFEPPALLRSMVRDGRLGKKVGRGFYEWSI